MRKFIIAISTLYFIFYSEVSKASSDYYLNSLCASAEGSQVVDCYKNDLLASNVELKKAEKNITMRIKKWHEMNDDRLDTSVDIALKRLEMSNESFTRYRFAQRSFAQMWGGGGGMASSTRIYSCEAYLNRQRAEQLNNANVADFSTDGD
ncbi:DUF1311 domain-containing protein [Salmonella enterica subsp. enterica]|nr:DUF1311 domain-containing protein [Salmonella enterica subsp. enterica serovar Fluntern]EAB1664708.1 DUF1311 domain-containing protein [Salmonella enterica]EBX7708947.1 DUF1311 domain-containing protein [Salmonella enterica subsp. enterica serovar Moero]EBY6472740.1 DUF1311 domain-containing protein [Salmonella enterica subsp. enterica serovar Hessarek]ECI0553222.1 DUF1311 domain-containing protein [Salmonella enterica subsp. enterica]